MSKLFDEFIRFAKKNFGLTIEKNDKEKELDFYTLFGFNALEMEFSELPEQIVIDCFDPVEEIVYKEMTPVPIRSKKSQIYDELHSDFAYAA